MNQSTIKALFPPITLNLIIINFIVWFGELVGGKYGIDIAGLFGLHYIAAPSFKAYQFISYMFLHDPSGIDHIFFNMFALWMFGGVVERFWGAKRYLFFYITCGLTAAITQELVWYLSLPPEGVQSVLIEGFRVPLEQYQDILVTIGASGAVFGLLLAYGLLFPNSYVFVSFIIPMKAKYFVILYGVAELFLGITPGLGGTVAHFAHVGGMIGGILLYLYWRKKGEISGPYN